MLGTRTVMAAAGPRSALQAIQALGLTTGLQLCLDAGDSVSYTSGQSWLDRSGNGYDFFRGTTAASQSTDPTFNGTAGQLSGNEYWSFDGGDLFTLDQANPTWVNNIPKNSAKWSFAVWVYITSASSTNKLISTFDSDDPCFDVDINATNRVFRFTVYNGSGAVLGVDSTDTVSLNQWTFGAGICDEAAATGIIQVQGTQKSFSDSYSSPGSANSDVTLKIGSGTNPVLNGTRIAMVNIWEGTVPTAANLLALYNLTRGRFGV